MISHETDKKFESRNGQSYDKTTVSLPTRARNTFVNASDFIVFIDIEKEKEGKALVDSRYIYFRSDSDIEAGSRFENVPTRIEYSATGFLEVFENAVLGAYEEDEEQMEKAVEKQEKKREENAKEFRDSQKSDSTDSVDVLEQINALVAKMDKEQQTQLKANLKAEFGTIQYKKYSEDKLPQALEVVKAILA